MPLLASYIHLLGLDAGSHQTGHSNKHASSHHKRVSWLISYNAMTETSQRVTEYRLKIAVWTLLFVAGFGG